MERQSFNNNWTFWKVGTDPQIVTLPHDAMIKQARMSGYASGSAQAYFPGGSYVYEKEFDKPNADHVVFQFEGVYKNARVLINGKDAGRAAYGYVPFFVCADDYLTAGKNVIRVECENADQPDSRWYTGAGIYRPVWMWLGTSNSIEPEQIRICTVSTEPTLIHVYTGDASARIEILDGDNTIATANGCEADIAIPAAKLWSAENPHLYSCSVKSSSDEATVKFGIRTITWNNKGFYINGKRTMLRGGCVHHDNGIIGAATHDEAEWRRVRILKESGYNALRSSHNPCSQAMLDACDYYGMYLIDEAWDMWFHHKNKFDYASQWREHHISDLASIISRDYNHPSVVMYSIGNEVSEPAKQEGLDSVKEMVSFIKTEDRTRPVTGGFNLMIIANAKKGKGIYNEDGGRANDNSDKMQGMNSTMFNMITNMVGTGMNKSANGRAADEATAPCLDALDIAGYNYASGRYPMEGKCHPNRLIYGSETFPQDIAKNWKMTDRYPYLIGDFMWTAWDYLGEVGLGTWAYTKDGTGFNKPYPWLLADTGAIDILGNPNGELFLAQAAWKLLDKPMIAVQPVNHHGKKPAKMVWRGTNAIPSWSWQGCDGEKAIVEVYTDAAIVELMLNGKRLAQKRVKGCKASFKIRYTPGTLTAVAKSADGAEQSRNELQSAGGALNIQLLPEAKTARSGKIIYVQIQIADAEGIVECNADRTLSISVKGGKLLGFGSANPRTAENFGEGTYTTYYGKALAAVRCGENGILEIRANDQAGNAASVVMQIEA